MAKGPEIGDVAPDFELSGTDGAFRLSDHRGERVILLFYPGDNTPVCTAQMCSVRDHWSEYQATGAEVVGISTDTVESHKGFAEKNQLPLIEAGLTTNSSAISIQQQPMQ